MCVRACVRAYMHAHTRIARVYVCALCFMVAGRAPVRACPHSPPVRPGFHCRQVEAACLLLRPVYTKALDGRPRQRRLCRLSLSLSLYVTLYDTVCLCI